MDRSEEFKRTVDVYANVLFRICFILLRNKEDVDDVIQDTFCKYWIMNKKFDSEEHKKAWLIKVSQNKCKDILKYKKIHSFISFDDVSERIQGDEPAETADINEILRLSNLNTKYKTVVILHYLEGYSVEETADILDISVSATKKRLQRAREKLKSFFEKYVEEGGEIYGIK